MTRVLTRRERRIVQRYAAAVDVVLDADRRFFERRPGREYRIRLMAKPEIDTVTIMGSRLVSPPGFIRFAVIRAFTLDCRMRVFLPAPEALAGDEVPETTAREIYEGCVRTWPKIRDAEAGLLTAAHSSDDPVWNGAIIL